MTTLDHSSPVALVRDIRLCGPTHHRFCFVAGGLKTQPWRFLSVFVRPTSSGDAELWFRIEYCRLGVIVEHTLLQGGKLFFVNGVFPDIGYVVSLAVSGPSQGGGSPSDASVDDSQSDQLDKNLRGIFA